MIYMDNSATTRLCDCAKEKIISALDCYGNPSSRHSLGIEAKKLIGEARDNVAYSLGLKKGYAHKIVFTSCGTEANNLAIFGSVYSKDRKRGNKIITTNSEHPSVENAMQRLQKDGYEVIRLSTVGGKLDIEEFRRHMDKSVILVSVMTVNNETGAVYDIGNIFSEAKKINPDVVTHTDAVQGYLKVKMDIGRLSADLVSISAHKIHGPKGVGALCIAPDIIKTKKIIPHIVGGGQENGLRSGTENLLGMVGFGAAAKAGFETFDSKREKLLELRHICEEQIVLAGAKINTPTGERAPHIISVALPRIKSETMLNFLSGKGICVSAGSACSSHSQHISSSLVGFGLSGEEADSTIRVSLCEYNTENEIKQLGEILGLGIQMLIKFKR
ncbi:MAG: cysteine desulfurase [Ruminococcaceae bacterium]|nr:cysteine desulfurase [Oscillospiraceae bacterium]